MPKKLPIYCQLDALKDFFAFEPDSKAMDSLLAQNFKQAKNRIDLQDLLLNRSKLHLDITKEDFEILLEADVSNRGWISLLSDSSQRKGDKGKNLFMPNSFDFLENEQASLPTDINPHTLFLIDTEKEACKEFERKYGFWFYNVERIFENCDFILSSALYNVTKSSSASFKLSDWGDLLAFRHSCNAMVIVDNYIFAKEENTISGEVYMTTMENIEYNIIPFLDNLLPTNITESKFDLTFITYKIGESFSNIHRKIKEKLQHIRTYNFNVSIVRTNGIPDDLHNHDRNIFTNYFWLHSGHSFTYFDNSGNVAKETNLTLHSVFGGFYTNEAGDNPVFDAVRLHLYKCKQICNEQTNTNYFRGDKQNRLFNML